MERREDTEVQEQTTQQSKVLVRKAEEKQKHQLPHPQVLKAGASPWALLRLGAHLLDRALGSHA